LAQVSPRHQEVPEFDTTAQGRRIATPVGGVLIGGGADTTARRSQPTRALLGVPRLKEHPTRLYE
jgi:hypothetical protein